jgi:FAD binding domain
VSHLPSSVFLAKTGRFQFWDTKLSDLTPACRVEPASSEEVSFVLKTLIDVKCHFAIKSGGHDRTPGSSNADGGVTIDLVRLNSIRITNDRRSVKIGAGLRWIDVYETLEREGLMVVGGRVADVGVGGLILGGRVTSSMKTYLGAAAGTSVLTRYQEGSPFSPTTAVGPVITFWPTILSFQTPPSRW